MYFRDPTDELIWQVLDNLREGDRHELCAAASVADPVDLWHYYTSCRPYQHLFHILSETKTSPPICMIGISVAAPGLGEAHMVATNDFPKIGLAVTAWVKGVMIPHLEMEFRRVECRALAANRRAVQWLRYLGAREECALANYGMNGETFLQFAWSGKNVPKQAGN